MAACFSQPFTSKSSGINQLKLEREFISLYRQLDEKGRTVCRGALVESLREAEMKRSVTTAAD